MTHQLFFFQLNKPVSHYLLKTFTFISTTFLLTFSCGGRGGGWRDNIYILLVYKASGAVVSRTIWGVPPKKANTSPPNVCEYKTFSTSEKKGNLQYTCNTSTCISEIY